MKEFALIFRIGDIADFTPSPEQMKERMEWLATMDVQHKLVDKGNSLLPGRGSAKTVKADNVVTDGPYTEIKEFIVGYVIIWADDIEEAVAIAKTSPVFKIGGNVEVREILGRE